MVVEYGEFQGHPTIILKEDENDEYPFSFGVRKAKKILDHIDEIKKFVKENSG